MNDWIGGTIGNYRIESPLGVGGMGRVYRAVHIHINRVAAIKVLHEQIAVDPAFQARFLREAQAVAALHHPNIVDILDFNEDKGVFYLVMEYVPDGSLRSLLKDHAEQQRRLPLTVGLDLVRQAAEALDYAHRSGMVHRDIKPDNLLLKHDPSTGKDIVKVADFGLARLGDSTVLTVEGQAMGTPAYMSPEQCQGIDLDGRCDIYSLGIVLFEVSTGSVPFVMKSLTDAIYKHVYVAPPSPRDVRPNLPEALSNVILRCLEKNPDDRFATAGELAAALNQILRDNVKDLQLASTLLEPPPAEQLRIMLDSGEVPLIPGQSSALTVTLVNYSSAPVQARISVDGIPDEWISTPSRLVQIAPGAEVSGPLRVQIPTDAVVDPGEYPVVVRAAVSDNPVVHAEATTRLRVHSSAPSIPIAAVPSAVPSSSGGGFPPLTGDGAASTDMPSWLPGVAIVVFLLAIAGIGYAFLRSDDSGDDDTAGLVAGTSTETFQAVSTDTVSAQTGTNTETSSGLPTADATETSVTAETATTITIVIEPDATATETIPAAATPTTVVEVTPEPPPFDSVIMFSTGRNFDDPAGSLDIYVMNPDGSDQHALISEPDDDWLSAMSPDLSRVAWVSRQHGNHQIYIANSDGSEVRRLTTSGGDDLHPLWSPNGRDILFIRNEDGDDELVVVNADDGSIRRLTNNNAYDGFAAWSPDGSRIVWSSGVNGNIEIFGMDMTNQPLTPRRLTDRPENDFNPVWSPDGTQIAFVSNLLGDNDIFLLQLNGLGSIDRTGATSNVGPALLQVSGSEAAALTSDSSDEFAPAWSPDGARIAFARKTVSAADVVIINVDGTGEAIIASNASPNDPDITWSPDSNQVAYLSEEAGNYDIWVAAIDGSATVRLTDAPGNDANLVWFSTLIE